MDDPFDPEGQFSNLPAKPASTPGNVNQFGSFPHSTSFPPANQNGTQAPILNQNTFPNANFTGPPMKPMPSMPSSNNKPPTLPNKPATLAPMPSNHSQTPLNKSPSGNSVPTILEPKPMPTASSLQAMPTVTSLISKPITSSPSESLTYSYDKAVELVQQCYAKLEKGAFAEALDSINQSIKVLSLCPDVQTVKRELKACANYKLLLHLLLEIKKSEQNLLKAAYLTNILAEIPAQPKHRLVCARMAINKNMEARNYRIAARLIRGLMNLQVVDAAQLAEKLKVCEENGFKNFQPFGFRCPACAGEGDALYDPKCQSCTSRILYCAQSFQPITQSFYLQCNLCETSFSNQVAQANQKCSFCQSANLVVTPVPKATPNQGLGGDPFASMLPPTLNVPQGEQKPISRSKTPDVVPRQQPPATTSNDIKRRSSSFGNTAPVLPPKNIGTYPPSLPVIKEEETMVPQLPPKSGKPVPEPPKKSEPVKLAPPPAESPKPLPKVPTLRKPVTGEMGQPQPHPQPVKQESPRGDVSKLFPYTEPVHPTQHLLQLQFKFNSHLRFLNLKHLQEMHLPFLLSHLV